MVTFAALLLYRLLLGLVESWRVGDGDELGRQRKGEGRWFGKPFVEGDVGREGEGNKEDDWTGEEERETAGEVGLEEADDAEEKEEEGEGEVVDRWSCVSESTESK